LNVVPDLQRVFVLPTGPIRVRIHCDSTEPMPPVVTVAAEENDWIAIRVACGLEQFANPTRDTVANSVKLIVETTLLYFPRPPSQIQIDNFRDALTAWMIEHRRVADTRGQDRDVSLR
jgi:hypothetical protein